MSNIERSNVIEYHSFYDNDNKLIDVTKVNVTDGKFVSVESNEGETLTNFTHLPEVLNVLGIGYITVGDVVKLHHFDKCLFRVGYGWHRNISNQEIYSWHLIPCNIHITENPYSPDGKILTFYREYLETIEKVDYENMRSSFIEGDE